MNCCNCDTKLRFSNWGNIRDVNNKPIPCCKDCADIVLSRIKENRFVEEYKGARIYLYKGRYYSYWGCAYSFDSVENCRNRIDMKNVAFVPIKLLNRVMQGKSLF